MGFRTRREECVEEEEKKRNWYLFRRLLMGEHLGLYMRVSVWRARMHV